MRVPNPRLGRYCGPPPALTKSVFNAPFLKGSGTGVGTARNVRWKKERNITCINQCFPRPKRARIRRGSWRSSSAPTSISGSCRPSSSPFRQWPSAAILPWRKRQSGPELRHRGDQTTCWRQDRMRVLEPNLQNVGGQGGELKKCRRTGEDIWSAMALTPSSEAYPPVRKLSTHPPHPPKQCWNGHWGQRSGSQLCDGGAGGRT